MKNKRWSFWYTGSLILQGSSRRVCCSQLVLLLLPVGREHNNSIVIFYLHLWIFVFVPSFTSVCWQQWALLYVQMIKPVAVNIFRLFKLKAATLCCEPVDSLVVVSASRRQRLLIERLFHRRERLSLRWAVSPGCRWERMAAHLLLQLFHATGTGS